MPATDPVTVEIVYSVDELRITTESNSDGSVYGLISNFNSNIPGRWNLSIDARRYWSEHNLKYLYNYSLTNLNAPYVYEDTNSMNSANQLYLSGFRRNSNELMVFTNDSRTLNSNQNNINLNYNDNNVFIGAAQYNNVGMLDGKIYAVRIYNKALTIEELNHNYQTDKERYEF